MGGGERHRAQRRAQLLEAARRVFVQKGYQATSVDDIVARLPVARGTFYLYFRDKRAVFEALVDDFFERIVGSIRSIDLSEGAPPPRAQLRANIARIVELALGEPETVQLALRAAPGMDPALDAKLAEFYEGLRRFVDESLQEGQRIGLVRPGDRRIMVSLALGGLKEILLDAVTGVLPRDADALVEAVMRFLEHGLLQPSP